MRSYVIQSDISQKEKKQISYIKAYMWNLEEWYRWAYLQGKNRDTDLEKSLVDTAGKGEGGTNWESSIEIYTLPCGK